MNEPMDPLKSYAVEVSGWDAKESFFVEDTRLEWNEQHVKKVVLRHAAKTGGMVFLRLIDPVKPPAKVPVAYRASRIQPAALGGSEVLLDQVWPNRTAASDGFADLAGKA